MTTVITILCLLLLSLFLLLRKRPSSQDVWISAAQKYTFLGIYDYVKTEINEMTRSSIGDMGLSSDAYQRELYKRSELITSLRRCVYGSVRDKQFVKSVIFDILKNSYLNTENIDKIIAFNNAVRLTAGDKFDIILYNYRKRYGIDAFNKLVQTYQLDRAHYSSENNGKYYYEIGENDIEKIFADENIYLSYEDKVWILSQRIYQHYKGFSVIDELREMQIDGISGGVSGILETEENINIMLDKFKNIPYNYDSIWVFYKGKSIFLSCLSFGSMKELKRVCQNIYRYNNTGMLSQNKGYKINDMIDGSRILVVRPDFAESWAFFIRKFNLAQTSLEKLITDKGSELPIEMIKFLAKGARITAITGAQGSGKTTLLMAMVGAIYGTLTLRIQEMAFELHLRKLYPKRNILSFRETASISGQTGLDVQKKTDGSVNILGEVATDEVAAWMVQMAQVASLFTIFTHHAKTTKDLVMSLRNSLLKCDIFRDERIAEEQVISVLDFDIHLSKDFNGKRYIERISEIIPVKQERLTEDFLYHSGEEMQRAFMLTMTTYFKRMTESHQYEVKDIIVFENGQYKALNKPSESQINAMNIQMDKNDQMRFGLFLQKFWEQDNVKIKSA